jgi:RimJ/RimL family protein N-acetyltransferase
MRFFIAHPSFMTELAEKLLEVDRCHCALGAFEKGRLLGVANYVAAPDGDIAEVAVAVAHAEHLRGVATALLRLLAEVARSNGIRAFTADVLAENSAMLKVLADAGWRHTTRLEGSVLKLRIELSEPVGSCLAGSVAG